jgi:hypothetical protein
MKLETRMLARDELWGSSGGREAADTLKQGRIPLRLLNWFEYAPADDRIFG